MNASMRPKNSTTVRARNIGILAAQAGFRIVSPHAPELAARWAERLFLTAQRHERPSWEVEALRSASLQRVPFEHGWLPVWTWSPARPHPDRTVLLVHGWEGRGSQLATFVPELLARGYRVVAFDAPGHGDSTLRRASVIEHARAIVQLSKSLGPFFGIVGHSVGGAATLLATRLGLEHPVARIALVSPPTSPEKFAAMFRHTLRLDRHVSDAMMARLEARYAMTFEELDIRKDAKRLAADLLVVHDRNDPIVAFEAGESIATLAPRGELLPTTGLGHRAILKAPHVIDAVASFIDGTPRRTFAETLDGELFLRESRWRRAI